MSKLFKLLMDERLARIVLQAMQNTQEHMSSDSRHDEDREYLKLAIGQLREQLGIKS